MVFRDQGGDACGRGCVKYIFAKLVVRKFVVLTGDDVLGDFKVRSVYDYGVDRNYCVDDGSGADVVDDKMMVVEVFTRI